MVCICSYEIASVLRCILSTHTCTRTRTHTRTHTHTLTLNMLLHLLKEYGYEEPFLLRRRRWDSSHVLRKELSSLVPVFDPRPGRNIISALKEFNIPAPGAEQAEKQSLLATGPKLKMVLKVRTGRTYVHMCSQLLCVIVPVWSIGLQVLCMPLAHHLQPCLYWYIQSYVHPNT